MQSLSEQGENCLQGAGVMDQRARMNQIRHAFNRYRSSAWPMHFAAVEQTREPVLAYVRSICRTASPLHAGEERMQRVTIIGYRDVNAMC